MRGILNGIVHWTWILITNVLVFKDGIIYWKRTKQESVSILGIAALKQIKKKKLTKNDPDN